MLQLTENGGPLTRQTLADTVYETLLEAILSGKIASGAELNEVVLARELGVSRTPVHEAIAWLAADELIELSVHRARVKTMTAQEVTDRPSRPVRRVFRLGKFLRVGSQLLQ